MTIDRKYFLKEFLRMLEHITDLEYQERIWVKEEGPECDSFIDTVCDFSSDVECILSEKDEFELTDKQYATLKKYSAEFEAFADRNTFPLLFMASPEWLRITEGAKQVLRVFNYTKQPYRKPEELR